MSASKITRMLDKTNIADSLKGYYADDELVEDLSIVPDEEGEFGEYRQCLNFELSGRGYHLLNQQTLKGKYVGTRINGKVELETEPEDIIKYMKDVYGFDAFNQ